MRRIWKDFLLAVFLGMILPRLVVNTTLLFADPEPTENVIPESKISRPVWVRTGLQVTQMDLERYLTGVVLAEMPASFEEEALKAQSVAARTYTQKALVTGGKHGDGSVCTESSCCQGYISETDYLEKGGTQEAAAKVAASVESTSGYVLQYDGELIEATYFSSSGGSTEAAVAVWGAEIPYLQAISSPEEDAQCYEQMCSFTPEEFQKALGRSLPGSPQDWITVTTYTEGGGVATMTIGGESYSGTQLRKLLDLRSTAFSVEAASEEIQFTTRGYGHRVGLSQYGANAMAAEGKNYREILLHYYPGTELVYLESNVIE